MKQIALLLFLHVSQAYVDPEECVIDYRSLVNVWELRLNNTLMCNYNANTPPKPLNGSDSIVVKPFFIVKSFQLWSEEQEFRVFTWTHISWKDERLQWNPNSFDGIDETKMKSFKLWMPGIKLYNSISDLYDQSFDPFIPCRISKNGRVECISYIEFQTKCLIDLSDWPFDTQVCSLQFGPWAVAGTRVRLDVDSEAVSFIGSEYGAEWDIMDYAQEEDQDAEIQIKLYFTLMRHTTNLAAIIVFPSILLSILTILTLFLDVRCYTRFFVACFSLMCHFYHLSELVMNIPKHSNNSPRILIYFRGSVIITFISICLTLLMKFLCERVVPVPNFIAILNKNVYETYAKSVIRPRWEVATDDDDKKEIAKAWTDFVSLLNSVWIYVSVSVYIVMCSVFIPTPSGLEQKIYSMSYDFE